MTKRDTFLQPSPQFKDEKIETAPSEKLRLFMSKVTSKYPHLKKSTRPSNFGKDVPKPMMGRSRGRPKI